MFCHLVIIIKYFTTELCLAVLVVHVKVYFSKAANRLVVSLFAELFPDQVPPQHRGDHQDPVEGHAEHRHPVVEGGAAVRTGQPLTSAMITITRSCNDSGGRK